MSAAHRDIVCFLMHSFTRVREPLEEVVYKDGAKFEAVLSFRRAFNYHPLYREVDGNRYAFHVYEFPEQAWGAPGVPEPNFGVWPSWHECIDHIAVTYAKSWKSVPDY